MIRKIIKSTNVINTNTHNTRSLLLKSGINGFNGRKKSKNRNNPRLIPETDCKMNLISFRIINFLFKEFDIFHLIIRILPKED
jgi:hypothetical protein